MTTYFILETVTREGMLTVKEAPTRSEAVAGLAAKYGVQLGEWFYTSGPADFVMRVEAADDEAVAIFTMALRKSGNVTIEVLKCYSPGRWSELVSQI